MVAPFGWDLGHLPRFPVAVDAIPDIGENQQIVFTEWMGRSPQDVEDQITYPLTVALLGLPDVKTVRSYSFLGFSSVYVIFRREPISIDRAAGCWRNSTVSRPGHCLKGFSRLWVPTSPLRASILAYAGRPRC